MELNTGLFNPQFKLSDQNINGYREAFYNLTEPSLMDHSIRRNEGELGVGGALLVNTGKFTGRSPKDKHIVVSSTNENKIWWERNARMEPKEFDLLYQDMLDHLNEKSLYVQDLFAGAEKDNQINVRIISELVWHSLFIRHLLIRPSVAEINTFMANFTIVNLPSFCANSKRHGCRSETVIAVNFDKKIILIAGTEYAGENKKAVFTILNYLLPEKRIMPMHCSANRISGVETDSAIFFGLSGTGKTTLSADGHRVLVGDDEHGWSNNGIFNFEGGCYAKTVNLSRNSEPEIYDTTSMFSTVVENMVYDPHTRKLDFEDDSLTVNMRAAYPMHYILNSAIDGLAKHPKDLIMLTCDAFGVMPPIALLSAPQAMYHFLSGFTSKTPGTERGVTEPEPTFSACFGAPFLPLRPEVYGDILKEKIKTHNTKCWLINTGWTGGPYGVGTRIPIHVTRSLLRTALDGHLDSCLFRKDINFGFDVPTSALGVDNKILDPRNNWLDKAAYDKSAKQLMKLFADNFKQYLPHLDAETIACAIV